MKIGIIGASGKAGSLILKEALTRGHEVTAIVRDEARVQIQGASVLEKDVFDMKAEDIKEFDVVVNAFGAAPGKEHLHVDAGKILIKAMKGAPQTKLIVVGGAGSLFVDEAKTIRVLDTPEFPKEYFATAFNQSKNLGDLQNATDIQWTFISPSAFFDPQGNRTGGYKLGKDNLLVNSKGESYVSYADFALAVLDEIENPQHINQRFTVVAEAE
ncbi:MULTISPECIES: NAD(P)-dependent oxidoreductase [unclassified Bacillus (in: firmicutes)]|uniref:NAD(P)-dependent oxidoreductase n=1 Tax=unclassified Bacillus (in: firmicutes) TaxID=185979 RepID=UPI001BEC806D|nr:MULTISPECIES: NAD(P)-dependent oxidoreductase [unclassified Bacillus (in: firmicutes)]MBT2617620.1 NAD(P)-dependent oxidoreductase [Bacillus sp. ISL-78]MBT2631679.1 NAD(P)-dependent oxidoreductase [Bacillus sp. ISL-101]MBT2715911.1 NAD(P)-dependent oxidoreductase [Bacillus sp. ISL-57]